MIEAKLKAHITKALTELGIGDTPVVLERPADIEHGDFATNVAMAAAKKAGKNPRALAEELITLMSRPRLDMVASMEVAGPGFINFKLSKEYFAKALKDALQMGENFGSNDVLAGKKVIVEYTDPNPFKEFHIGHLMSNTIGESISRIIEASGAETMRACYQGDVGLHVAKAMWGAQHPDMTNVVMKTQNVDSIYYWSWAYVNGAKAYDADENTKKEIQELNKNIYNASDQEINKLYNKGRALSLEYFEEIYKRLGTQHGEDRAFNFYFLESKTGEFGKELVLNRPEIFPLSDGARIYAGDEAKGLHTRVFVNKEGLPTYEAKELGLAQIKYDAYPYDVSIVITGNEVNDYFKVLLDAMSKVFPEFAAKTEHYGHGMLRLPTGKMSSRAGDVITANWLLDSARAETASYFLIEKKLDELSEEQHIIAEAVAVAAVKYSILRQATGKDVVFDFEQSLSFEGDSGPYLQYAYARTRSLLAKAEGKNIDVGAMPDNVCPLHKYILRFPEVVLRAEEEREPHYITTYLIELAREFSAFYGNTIVLDGAPDEPYKLALVSATSNILKKGLWLLGMPILEKM
jgi:arginyl-tRNA synthetase